MNFNDMRKQGKLYSKLSLTITACISLTLLLTTILYYTYYTQVEKTQAFRSDLNNLTLTSRGVISLTENAQSLSFQLYRNYTISKILYYSNPSIYEVTAAMSELNSYLSSIPYIDSIYVYNPGNSKIYVASSITSIGSQNGVISKSELMDKGILDILKNNQNVKPFTPIPRTYSTQESGKMTPVYSFLCFDTINWNQSKNSAIVVNISADWINREVPSSTNNGTLYLLDHQGRFLSGSNLLEQSLSTAEKRWLDQKITNNDAGYFVDEFQGKKSLISYTSPDKLGWQYVRVTPYGWITKQTNKIRNATLIISIVIFIGGIIISRYLSKRLYMPISDIMHEMDKLTSEKRNNMYTLKQNALRDLVLGLKPASLNQPQALQQLGINFNYKEGFRVVLLRIDHYNDLYETQGAYIHPFKFAIMNIATEICGSNYHIESVDMNDDNILLLINTLNTSSSSENEIIENLLQQIREACLEYLKISITSIYGSISHDVGLLNQQFFEAKDASWYRFFSGYGSIISTAAVSNLNNNNYVYPADLEKKMVEALIGGKAQNAANYFYEMIDDTRFHSFDVVKLTYSRIKISLQAVIDNIRKRGSIPLDGISDVPSLDNIETLAQLKTIFIEYFEEICSHFLDKKSVKHNDLVRQINEKISNRYNDPNLSINQIADELDMSSIYISRIYKQQTLHSIMDVVLETRIKEVCRLLKDTDQSVSAIAAQTGFTSSSYLHRTFKRLFNVTPVEYRRSLR